MDGELSPFLPQSLDTPASLKVGGLGGVHKDNKSIIIDQCKMPTNLAINLSYKICLLIELMTFLNYHVIKLCRIID